jgi:hypothetical protein
MANWCYNIVSFQGETTAIHELQKLFEKLAKQEIKQQCGQLPEFIKTNDGYLFKIRWEDDTLYYETRWSPNTEIVKQVADTFNVDFTHFYEELGCLIYGEAEYKNKILTDIFLEAEDFDSFQKNEKTDEWFFEGKNYESDLDILEILLERKQQNNKHDKDK